MGEITLRKAIEDYKTVYMAYRNFAERTRVEYLNDLEDLVEYLERIGIDRVGKLELAKIERYLAELERQGFTGATRKRKTVAIRSFLNFLYQDGYIQSNISKQIIPPFVDNKMPRYLTEAEYNRLRSTCSGSPRDVAIIELLLQTGMRLSELTHLKMDDVDLAEDAGYIRITGIRSRKERVIPLNSIACEALNTYLAERPSVGSPILFLNRFDAPLSDRGVQKLVRNYLKMAGLGKASVHTVRHTFGIHHAAKGTSSKTLQQVLGYKDKRSLSVYFSFLKEVEIQELQENSL
jgi:integrase/recombinase XerD